MRGRGKWSEKITDAEYIERIKSRVRIDDRGCWIWNGFIFPSGYAGVSYRNKGWKVHRLMFHLCKPPLVPELDVCHTCDVPHCVNPAHLWQGTAKDNMRDASRKKRIALQRVTHCPRGHEYTQENTKVTYANGHRMRHCKLCSRVRLRLKAGWTLEEAMTLPPVKRGYRRSSLLNGVEQ